LNLSTAGATNEMRVFAGIGRCSTGGLLGGFMHPSHPLAACSAALVLMSATIPQLAQARELVGFSDAYSNGTVVVKTGERALYYVLGNGKAVRYPVGVGRAGKQWTGTATISSKQLSPAWSPPEEVKRDKPSLPNVIPGGSPSNPMGAAAMTLSGGGEYAIHGTNDPRSIGGFVSYGCIRMYNADVLDLYNRVSWGTPVVVTR
jgi:lipoprotein-anchoring transpeptidase ErfK/SrfK